LFNAITTAATLVLVVFAALVVMFAALVVMFAAAAAAATSP